MFIIARLLDDPADADDADLRRQDQGAGVGSSDGADVADADSAVE